MTVQSEVKTEVKDQSKLPEIPESKQPSPEKEQIQSQSTQKPPEETQEQINWRKFRQERDRERKEKAETDRRLLEKEKEASALKAAMEALVNKPTVQQSEPEEETEDQRIQKKVDKALEIRDQQYAVERQKREAAELPQKLQSTFNDFNQVCSQENIDYLEYHHPEIWAGFKNSSGTFDVWAGLYKTIKKMVPNTDSRKEQARVEKNLSKPQSMSSPGMTTTGDQAPSMLNEQKKKDNWARMKNAIKSL